MTRLADSCPWNAAVRDGSFGVWDLDPLLEMVHYSPAWKQRLGFPDPTLPDSTSFWRCRVHPGDLQPMMDALRAHFDGYTGTYEMTFRLRSNGSGYRTVVSRGRVVARDARGNATRMVGTMSDITGRPVAHGHGLPAHEQVPRLVAAARLPLHLLLESWTGESPGGNGPGIADEGRRLVAVVEDLLDVALRQTAGPRPGA